MNVNYEEELVNLAKKYSDFSLYEKNLIYRSTICNDIRYIKTLHPDFYNNILENIYTLNLADENFSSKIILLFLSTNKKNIDSHNKELEIFITSVMHNYMLIKKNRCPLLNYCFNKWISDYELNENESFHNQLELSIIYLYRLVKISGEFKNNNESGAYSKIEFNDNNNVLKIPKNYAAKIFMNKMEYRTYAILKELNIKENIPQYFSIDSNSTITKEYIYGKTGHELLENKQINKEMLQNLESLYYKIKKISESSNISLDIHPNNFIWSKKDKRWFLIDLGPIPKICFEYYDAKNFAFYYHKVWESRFWLMEKQPIRSVFLDTDLI